MKWFHAIGASGKATANVCKMFKEMGWFVTGSDIQFLPPASNIIIENEIPFDLDYSFKHLTKDFWEEFLKQEQFQTYNLPWDNEGKLDVSAKPDLCLIVESASDRNKEYRYALLNKIPVKPYSQIFKEYLVKENSIVIVGSAGKTTTTSLITKILESLNLDPSYMIGADVIDFKDSIKNTASKWSVIEGDEYHSKTLSNGAKFLEYKPKYLLITNVGWEHFDIFPTREDYLLEFKKVIDLVPENGVIVASSQVDTSLFKDAKVKVIRYGEAAENDFNYKITEDSALEQKFDIYKLDKKIISGKTVLWGKYNIENILGVFALINNIPDLSNKIKVDELMELISQFRGPRKRLELISQSKHLTIIDDFGVAPDRAKNSLNTLRNKYPESEIIAIFEPNSGSRPKDAEGLKKSYKGVFENADLVVIPELSKFNAQLADELDFKNILNELGINVITCDLDSLLENIKNKINSQKHNVVVFFSAYRLDKIAKELASLN